MINDELMHIMHSYVLLPISPGELSLKVFKRFSVHKLVFWFKAYIDFSNEFVFSALALPLSVSREEHYFQIVRPKMRNIAKNRPFLLETFTDRIDSISSPVC